MNSGIKNAWIFASAPNDFTFVYFVLATHRFEVLRRIDQLLGNDYETNETTAIAREQIEQQQ
jgi:hypothetical protein